MRYTLRQAAEVAGGRTVGGGVDVAVAEWTFDSRRTVVLSGTCFLALQGPTRSGAEFVSELIAAGIGMFCVSEKDYPGLPQGPAYWIVDDVLRAVQTLAADRRARYEGTVVGVTGSNGKTIVKEWLNALLGGEREGVYRSPGSFNSQLGVALSVLGIPAFAKTAVIEAGVSRAGEMAQLAAMIKPDVGIFTNLGDAHASGFVSFNEKFREKCLLFKDATKLILQRKFAEEHAGTLGALNLDARLVTWSYDTGADYFSYPGNGLLLDAHDEAIAVEYELKYAGAASFENITNSLVAALELGGEPSVLAERMRHLPLPNMRLSISEGNRGLRIVDDSYTNDGQGLLAAVEMLGMQRRPSDTAGALAILGPLADGAAAWPADLLERFGYAGVSDVWWVGNIQVPPLNAGVRATTFTDVDEAIGHLAESPPAQRAVLVKGPRAAGFERIAAQLRRRVHEVRLEISLDALEHNLAAFRARLRPTTKVCVMVKASAYGSGSYDVARFFAERGVDYLAVANVDEGVELRQRGSTLPIIVGNARPDHAAALISHSLEPEVTTLAQLEAFAGLRLHLKLETGMHRLGFDAVDEADTFRRMLEVLRKRRPEVVSVFSHLSAAGSPAADGFSRKQNERLLAATTKIEAALGYRPMLHLLNSAGAWRLPEYQHDMVRLGIGVYGAGMDGVSPGKLEAAHRLVAQIVQVRTVRAGDVVGYGLGGVADVDRRIGVVNIGYADGLRRSAGDGAYGFYLGDAYLPTVGSVCMDFTMVDLAEAPQASEGNEVELFGERQPVRALADCYGTIVYEVFTGIGPRVRRVYYR